MIFKLKKQNIIFYINCLKEDFMDLNRIDQKPIIVSDDQAKPKRGFKKSSLSEGVDLQKININKSLDESKNDSLEFLSNKVEKFENNKVEIFNFVCKKPTDVEFNMLEKACNHNAFNITVHDDYIEVGKNKIGDKNYGFLTPEGLVFNESFQNKNLNELPVFYTDNMSTKDKELAQSFLKDSPIIYIVTSDQMNKLKFIYSNRIEKEKQNESKNPVEKEDSQKIVEKNLNGKTEDLPKEVKIEKILNKIYTATHFFKIDILKDNRAREKRQKNEAIEKRKEVEFEASKENQVRIDKKLDDQKKLAKKNLS